MCNELKIEISDEIVETIYWSLLDYVEDSCMELCKNECILDHEKNAYCNFCGFGSKSLPCPKAGEISYDAVKASYEDMEH